MITEKNTEKRKDLGGKSLGDMGRSLEWQNCIKSLSFISVFFVSPW